MKSGKQTFEQEMDSARTASRLIGGKFGPEEYASAFSRSILYGDLGYHADSPVTNYGLDDATRDRLIAHARQDAALIYATLTQTRKEIRSLRNLVWLTMIIAAATLLFVRMA